MTDDARTASIDPDERCDEGHWCCPWLGRGSGDHDHFMLPSSCAACAPARERLGLWEPTDQMRSIVDEHHDDTDGLLRALHGAGLLAVESGRSGGSDE